VDLDELQQILPLAEPGAALHALVERLYPMCRSMTGQGVRDTLAILGKEIPLEVHEVPSGTAVLDWTVPKEWNVRDAFVKDSKGERVVDFRLSNLHVVGYSAPVSRKMSLGELKSRLHSLPEHPDWVPYRTAYFRDDWGFCLAHKDLVALPDGEYEVCVDSSLRDGNLTYGECVVPGATPDEILVSAHVCHPSLCNDNLSGIAVATLLARYAVARAKAGRPLRHTFHFVFAPATIGAITWLARNRDRVDRIRHGLVLTLLGDRGKSTYKRSRRGNAPIDRAAAHVLSCSSSEYAVRDFLPFGYDERQYCSPGFDLPVGCLMRTPFAEFPEYHTSADNLDFVTAEHLLDSLRKCISIFDVVERDASYLNLSPYGEPQLGRRGIYKSFAERSGDGLEMALLWVLNQSDGNRSLLDIAEKSRIPFHVVARAADVLTEHGLIKALERLQS
jgi:aminopeptidase-like protein